VSAIADAARRASVESTPSTAQLPHCRRLGDALQRLALAVDELLCAPGVPTRDEVRTLRLLSTEALHGLGAVVQEVNAQRWSGPLDDALRSMVADFALATGAASNVRIRGSLAHVTVEVVEAVRRVVGEALANVDRHARAGVLLVTLDVEGGTMDLDIVDDGVGLASRQAAVWGSSVELGLRRMHRAMRSIGGTLTVHPLEPRGLRLHAAAPTCPGGGQ
jgi:signal transduction histidine kinase